MMQPLWWNSKKYHQWGWLLARGVTNAARRNIPVRDNGRAVSEHDVCVVFQDNHSRPLRPPRLQVARAEIAVHGLHLDKPARSQHTRFQGLVLVSVECVHARQCVFDPAAHIDVALLHRAACVAVVRAQLENCRMFALLFGDHCKKV